MQVAGEPEALLVRGELGDRGPRLAQLHGRTHQLAHADHREPDEQDQEQAFVHLALAVVHSDQIHRHGRRGNRPERGPDRQGRPAGDRHVDEEPEPVAAEREGQQGREDTEDRQQRDDDPRCERPAHVPEDQRQIGDDEGREAGPAGGGGERGVVRRDQVLHRRAEEDQPDADPQRLHQQLAPVSGSLADAHLHLRPCLTGSRVFRHRAHAFSVSFRYSQAAPPAKRTK